MPKSAEPIKNLTVRLDPETREKLELIADRELRPMANQIVIFVRQSIERYIQENKLEFRTTDHALSLEPDTYAH